MPSEQPNLSRSRAIAIADRIHGIANQLYHENFFTIDEVDNPIAQHVEDQIEALANVLTALAGVCGEAWRIEK